MFKKERTLNLAFAFDENFIIPFYVLLTSIFATNKLLGDPLIAFVTLLASLPVAITLLPAASAALAISNPIPLLAPVINQTLLFSIVLCFAFI